MSTLTAEPVTLSPALQTMYAPIAAELAEVEAIFRREMHHPHPAARPPCQAPPAPRATCGLHRQSAAPRQAQAAPPAPSPGRPPVPSAVHGLCPTADPACPAGQPAG